MVNTIKKIFKRWKCMYYKDDILAKIDELEEEKAIAHDNGEYKKAKEIQNEIWDLQDILHNKNCK